MAPRTAPPYLADLQPVFDGTVTTVYPERVPVDAVASMRCLSATRVETAVITWALVAGYISDHDPISPTEDLTLAEACEAYVAQHAAEAEGVGQHGGYGVISAALHSLGVFDDYLRMKSGEQWMAFGETVEQARSVR